eukprot:jgi/Ulvmu1/10407/UM062_0002.1
MLGAGSVDFWGEVHCAERLWGKHQTAGPLVRRRVSRICRASTLQSPADAQLEVNYLIGYQAPETEVHARFQPRVQAQVRPEGQAKLAGLSFAALSGTPAGLILRPAAATVMATTPVTSAAGFGCATTTATAPSTAPRRGAGVAA